MNFWDVNFMNLIKEEYIDSLVKKNSINFKIETNDGFLEEFRRIYNITVDEIENLPANPWILDYLIAYNNVFIRSIIRDRGRTYHNAEYLFQLISHQIKEYFRSNPYDINNNVRIIRELANMVLEDDEISDYDFKEQVMREHMKECLDCGIDISQRGFNAKRCIDCQKINAKETAQLWKFENQEVVKQAHADYRLNNTEKIKERNRAYYWNEDNTEKIKEKKREYYYNRKNIESQDIDTDLSNPVRKEYIDSLIKMMGLAQKKYVNDINPAILLRIGASAIRVILRNFVSGGKFDHLADIISEKAKQFYKNNPNSTQEPEEVVKDIVHNMQRSTADYYRERELIRRNIEEMNHITKTERKKKNKQLQKEGGNKRLLEAEAALSNALPLLNKPKGMSKRTKAGTREDINYAFERIRNL